MLFVSSEVKLQDKHSFKRKKLILILSLSILTAIVIFFIFIVLHYKNKKLKKDKEIQQQKRDLLIEYIQCIYKIVHLILSQYNINAIGMRLEENMKIGKDQIVKNYVDRECIIDGSRSNLDIDDQLNLLVNNVNLFIEESFKILKQIDKEYDDEKDKKQLLIDIKEFANKIFRIWNVIHNSDLKLMEDMIKNSKKENSLYIFTVEKNIEIFFYDFMFSPIENSIRNIKKSINDEDKENTVNKLKNNFIVQIFLSFSVFGSEYKDFPLIRRISEIKERKRILDLSINRNRKNT